MPDVDDSRLLVGSLTQDDAAVYRLTDDRLLVATLDFFTPIVDDAYLFGAIAATNALSDLYAMGADPLFVLNIVAWPRQPELLELAGATVQGSGEKVREAGAFTVGGHSIEDAEPKFGLVALGEATPETLWTNAGAQRGDRLILTKPIGTGILSTALKRELILEADMADAIASMTTLNRDAAAVAHEFAGAIHAATDISGFGLLGHLHAMLRASGGGARLFAPNVPKFARADEFVAAKAVPGGTERNAQAAADYTQWGSVERTTRTLLADAQTSGGLLFSVAPDAANRLVGRLRSAGTPAAAIVGEVTGEVTGSIEVVDDQG